MDLIKPGGVLVGDVRLYVCKAGYMSLGPLETICVAADGKAGWKAPDYNCVGNSFIYLPHFSLNFDVLMLFNINICVESYEYDYEFIDFS